MQKVLKHKWIVLALWIIAAIGLYLTMPSLDVLVKEKGQPKIDGNYPSTIAAELKKEMSQSQETDNQFDAIIVYHHKNELSANHLTKIKENLESLKSKSELSIRSTLDPFINEQAKDKLMAKDKKTMMVILTMEQKSNETIKEIRERLSKEAKVDGVETYLTGNAFIIEDFSQTSIDGVKKTEFWAILFIIIVLIAVFRSPVTPLISLISVGISYIVSLGIVANLVEYLDFPFANTTQIFLVLVLFGIGTDYNILLFMRLKEELGHGKDIKTAILHTYRTAGKTVFFSGLAAGIGFGMLAFAEFQVYRSAVAVSIGVIILLLVLFTLVPFFMHTLHQILFWPSKKITTHQENRLYSFLGQFSIKRSFLSLFIVAIFSLPMIFLYKGTLSYDNLQEVHPDFESVKGFNKLADSFGAGNALMTSVYLKDKEPLDSNEALAFIDELSERLSQIEGINLVMGPTRPEGKEISELYLNQQTKELNKGLNQASEGLDKVTDGLNTMSSEVNKGSSNDMSNINKLLEGTKSSQAGLGEVKKALEEIEKALTLQAGGAADLSKGVKQLEKELQKLDNLKLLYNQYKQIQQPLNEIKDETESSLKQVQTLKQQYPDLKEDATMQKLEKDLMTSYGKAKALSDGVKEANKAFSKAMDGLKDADLGLSQLTKGAEQLSKGLKDTADGQAKTVDAVGEIHKGLGSIYDGQKQMSDGLTQLVSNLKELQKGLDSSAEGTDKVSKGITDVSKFLEEVEGDSATNTFFIPEQARNKESFKQMLDMYMSEDRKIAKLNLTMTVNPYSQEAMKVAEEVNQTIKETIQNTPFEDWTYGVGEVASANNDMDKIASNDFKRAVTFMLAGVGLMLLFLFRSFWMTLFVMLSLIVSYFVSLTISELIFIDLLEQPGLSWTVPFFSFITIVSLGVDYSIFLIMRYKEYHLHKPTVAILEAMKQIGSVILSAMIILAGTFAALYPSEVTTLMQIATIVIVGLILLVLIMLPIFIPAMVSLKERFSQKAQMIRPKSKKTPDVF